jgi:hypothetical protein
MKKVIGVVADGSEFSVRELSEDEQIKLNKLNVQFEN